MDALHIRWLTFCEVRTFPRDTNEIITAVLDQLPLHDKLETGLMIAAELDFFEVEQLLVVHAQDDNADLLEVRLADA